MTSEPARVVTVHADLTLELGDHPVTVTADGRDLTVAVDDLDRVLDAVADVPLPVGTRSVPTRQALRSLTDRAAHHGVQARVLTPTGAVITVGRDTPSSRLTRWVTGSDHVAVDVRALRPHWRSALRLLVRHVRARRRG